MRCLVADGDSSLLFTWDALLTYTQFLSCNVPFHTMRFSDLICYVLLLQAAATIVQLVLNDFSHPAVQLLQQVQVADRFFRALLSAMEQNPGGVRCRCKWRAAERWRLEREWGRFSCNWNSAKGREGELDAG